MKKNQILSVIAGALLLVACAPNDGKQLIGVQDRPSWEPIVPYVPLQYVSTVSIASHATMDNKSFSQF